MWVIPLSLSCLEQTICCKLVSKLASLVGHRSKASCGRTSYIRVSPGGDDVVRPRDHGFAEYTSIGRPYRERLRQVNACAAFNVNLAEESC